MRRKTGQVLVGKGRQRMHATDVQVSDTMQDQAHWVCALESSSIIPVLYQYCTTLMHVAIWSIGNELADKSNSLYFHKGIVKFRINRLQVCE